MTCWRRLRDWNNAGVWTRLHENLLAKLHAAGALDWSLLPQSAKSTTTKPADSYFDYRT
jgi:hypothetical protein